MRLSPAPVLEKLGLGNMAWSEVCSEEKSSVSARRRAIPRRSHVLGGEALESVRGQSCPVLPARAHVRRVHVLLVGARQRRSRARAWHAPSRRRVHVHHGGRRSVPRWGPRRDLRILPIDGDARSGDGDESLSDRTRDRFDRYVRNASKASLPLPVNVI